MVEEISFLWRGLAFLFVCMGSNCMSGCLPGTWDCTNLKCMTTPNINACVQGRQTHCCCDLGTFHRVLLRRPKAKAEAPGALRCFSLPIHLMHTTNSSTLIAKPQIILLRSRRDWFTFDQSPPLPPGMAISLGVEHSTVSSSMRKD